MALAVASAGAIAECNVPAIPTIPDGASARLADMLEAQKSVQTYQTLNMEYMKCLEQAFTAAEAATRKGSDEDKAAANRQYQEAVDAYNKAVSTEEDIAGRFNTEIREYKAANPG
jgi:hypothetical protein